MSEQPPNPEPTGWPVPPGTAPDLRPGAVEAAVAWLAGYGDMYTRPALEGRLHEAGYTDAEIAEAFVRLETGRPTPTPFTRDLRARAALILIVVFLGTWLVFTILLMRPSQYGGVGYGGVAALVLGILLGVVGLISLIGIAASGRLRRGAEGALAAVLALPFVLLVIIAGLCVSTTNGLRT